MSDVWIPKTEHDMRRLTAAIAKKVETDSTVRKVSQLLRAYGGPSRTDQEFFNTFVSIVLVSQSLAQIIDELNEQP